jgi:hypothetical protein
VPRRAKEEIESPGEEVEAAPDTDRLVRVAEARQIERDHAIGAGDRLHHLAPEEGGGRPAVQEQHGRTRPELSMSQPQPSTSAVLAVVACIEAPPGPAGPR